jgi:hypothetical protein
MKVAINCESPLLQKTLEIFLDGSLTSYKQCDVLISDRPLKTEKRFILIANDEEASLQKPFTRSQLMALLGSTPPPSQTTFSQTMDFYALEKKIDQLTQEYTRNVVHTVREFYYGQK